MSSFAVAGPLSGGNILDARVPEGPLAGKWQRRRSELALVGPVRRRQHRVIVVGAGLAGATAAAGLAELGYAVTCLCFHDSARRAHSVAAQGGINAAKDYQNDGDSVDRLFRDTLKGGDFRAREANVYRLAEISARIVDHCVALGVPFAREYGGLLANRSFGGALVSRTFYARGQTGQQLLLGATSALAREVGRGGVRFLPRREMLDLIVVDGRARGVVARDLIGGALETHLGDAVVLATGGYANAYYLSTNACGSNATAIWRAHRRGAAFANPGFVQFHPTCLPAGDEHQAKLTLMSESLRNDGRVWVPRSGDERRPRRRSPRESGTTSSNACTRATATSARAIWPRARPWRCATRAGGWGPRDGPSTWTWARRSAAWGRRRCANVTATCSRCTSASPTRTP